MLPISNNFVIDYVEGCDVCLRAKHCRGEFESSSNKASKAFDLIHCDLWRPYRNSSFYGATYFLTIVDDFSRAVWVYLLNNKREVARIF